MDSLEWTPMFGRPHRDVCNRDRARRDGVGDRPGVPSPAIVLASTVGAAVVLALACALLALATPPSALARGMGGAWALAGQDAAHGPHAPAMLSETGLYSEPATLLVDPRHLAFSPQYPLWTDGATKRRWISLPPGSAIDASDPDAWVFPAGTRFWKEFAFGGRPVETRYIERRSDGTWLFAAYEWMDDGRDARLAPASGRRGAYALGEGRAHTIPGVTDCKVCHEGQATPVLGFSALQLSADRDPAAPHAEVLPAPGVDLRFLRETGLITGLPDSLPVDARIAAASPMERAAIGYLHGNCGHCHNDEGPLRNLVLSLRHQVGQSGDGAAGGGEPAIATTAGRRAIKLGADGTLRIAPGDPDRSLLLRRMASRLPAIQMPPLGSVVPDDDAIALLGAWIDAMETDQSTTRGTQ
jgi:hypothetical protein